MQATKQTALTDCHADTSITLDTEQASPRVVVIAIEEVDCSRLTDTYPRALFELTHDAKHAK